MKKKKLILSGDFRFRFSAENECPFSFLAVNVRSWGHTVAAALQAAKLAAICVINSNKLCGL